MSLDLLSHDSVRCFELSRSPPPLTLGLRRLSRDCCPTRHTAFRYFHSRSAAACFALPARLGSQLPNYPSFLVLFLALPPRPFLRASYVHACFPESRVPVFASAYASAYIRVIATRSVTFPGAHVSFRSLHRYESCTEKSCQCGRQALPGRISLSGNVPTEQPTLALTLCPFRGVLWRKPSLSLALSLSYFRLTPAFSPSHYRASDTLSHPPPYFLPLAPRRLVLRTTVRVSLRLEPRRTKPSCAPGANTNPCGSPDARRRRWLAKSTELSRAATPLSHSSWHPNAEREPARVSYHAGATPESSPSPQNTTCGHVAAPTGPATRTLEMRRTLHDSPSI